MFRNVPLFKKLYFEILLIGHFIQNLTYDLKILLDEPTKLSNSCFGGTSGPLCFSCC
jgi:hypothetical protein